MNVAIFGGGVAGLVAATALHTRLDSCRVYERRGHGAGGGLGFILSAQALADLAELGAPSAATAAGVALREFRRYDPAGEVRHAQPMPAGWRGVRRVELLSALAGPLPAGTVTTGAALCGLLQRRDGAATALVTTLGNDPERVPADLYVAADGARSLARRAIFPGWPQRSARVWEIVAIARDPEISGWAGADFHKFSRPGLAAGVLPVGDETVVWFIQFDRDRFAPPDTGLATAPSEPAAEALTGPVAELTGEPLRRRAYQLVGDWGHPLPALLRTTDFTRAHLWRPVDTDLVPHLHSGNLALVGDAAHPLLPFTSQGVAAAIAGVRDLALALDQHYSLAAALETYSTSCRARCAPYIGQGRELTRRFLQLDGRADDLLPVST